MWIKSNLETKLKRYFELYNLLLNHEASDKQIDEFANIENEVYDELKEISIPIAKKAMELAFNELEDNYHKLINKKSDDKDIEKIAYELLDALKENNLETAKEEVLDNAVNIEKELLIRSLGGDQL